jgi:hypothetical protein
MKEWIEKLWKSKIEDIVNNQEKPLENNSKTQETKTPQTFSLEEKGFKLDGFKIDEKFVGPLQIENETQIIRMNLVNDVPEGEMVILDKKDSNKNITLNFSQGKLNGQCNVEGNLLDFSNGILNSMKKK